MKRFLIVIFALLYIGLSSGITLTIHHCMGKLQVIKYVPMAIALLFDLRDLYNLPETEQEANIPVHSNTPPEWSGTDRLIHHCTFLI